MEQPQTAPTTSGARAPSGYRATLSMLFRIVQDRSGSFRIAANPPRAAPASGACVRPILHPPAALPQLAAQR